MEFERDGVKLHATVMNCSFLGRSADAAQLEVHRGRRRKRPTDTIDATGVFKASLSLSPEVMFMHLKSPFFLLKILMSACLAMILIWVHCTYMYVHAHELVTV